MSFWSDLALGVGVVVATVVVIALLSYEKFIQWFQQRQGLLQSDKDLVGVSITQKLSNGDVKVFQGVFDTNREECIENQVTTTRRLDSRIANAHNEQGIAIWT